jgi:hypothetical protein
MSKLRTAIKGIRIISWVVCGAVSCQLLVGDVYAVQNPDGWTKLESGLELGSFDTGEQSGTGGSKIHVLRIDPSRFEPVLFNTTSLEGSEPLTAREWSRRHDLVAAINPSMFQKDFRRSVSLMQTGEHVNNPRVSKDMSILAFDPIDDGLPLVRIIDRQCDDFEKIRPRYATFIQSIRMISCKGANVWKQQKKRWSTAVIATDSEDNLLFIHARAPFSTHDLINVLKALPLRIVRAMYADGGAQAQLYVKSGEQEHEFLGKLELGFGSTGSIQIALPMPNVLGVRRRVLVTE